EEACQFNKNKVAAKISSYEQVKQGDEEQLKIAVGTRGPVSVAIQTTDKWQSYTEGIFDDNTCTAGASNHIVLVVGYGTTDDGKDYWIVKNSYGLYWGDGGYIKMARNHNNICGIADDAVVPVV
ncbi:cathepsin L, partial [Aphelenchoides avenae]